MEVENSEHTAVRAVNDGLRLMTDLVRIRQQARQGRYPAPDRSGDRG